RPAAAGARPRRGVAATGRDRRMAARAPPVLGRRLAAAVAFAAVVRDLSPRRRVPAAAGAGAARRRLAGAPVTDRPLAARPRRRAAVGVRLPADPDGAAEPRNCRLPPGSD